MQTISERQALVFLNSLEGVGPKTILKIKDLFPDVVSVFGASLDSLVEKTLIYPKVAKRILEFYQNDSLEKEFEFLEKENIQVITLWDENYPILLKDIVDPPPVLFMKGKLVQDQASVAIVGARSSTQYGNQTAYRLSFQLAGSGAAVVSGLARGIDSYAHEGALSAKGATWAVMGCGFRHFYPRENRKLAQKIIESGCIMTEFSSDIPPVGINFPRRNRIISGLAKGVVVVEASKNSGSLITADFALEQGRSVLAVPGRIDVSQATGALHLIRDGAKMVLSVEDIIEELGLKLAPQIPINKSSHANEGTEQERSIVEALGEDTMGLDELSAKTKILTCDLLSILFSLELKRIIKPLPGKRYVRMLA